MFELNFRLFQKQITILMKYPTKAWNITCSQLEKAIGTKYLSFFCIVAHKKQPIYMIIWYNLVEA